MSLQIQQKIKQNALEIREYVTDLYDWEQEMELKQKTKAKLKGDKIHQQPQIRQATVKKEKEAQKLQPQQKPKKELIRDSNTVSDYYKAWDKFDVDKEITKLEEQQQKAYKPYNPYENSKNNLRAKPKIKININGKRAFANDPTELKDKGNLHFQSLQFDKAIHCYTECLTKLNQETAFENLTEEQKKLRCVVLSNRAMSYLKIQQTIKALEDCNMSIMYCSTYAKSYYRKGECEKKLGKYKDAIKSFKMVKRLQPTDCSRAQSQIKKIEAFLIKRNREAKEAMIITYNPSLMINSKKIEIEEVDNFEEKTNFKPNNYLQQL